MPTTSIGDVKNYVKERESFIEDFRSKPVSMVKRNAGMVGFIVVMLLLSVMFAAQIITGVFALILTVATLGGGLFFARWLKAMDPVIQEKLKNMQIKKLMEETHNNAVERLRRTVISNTEKIDRAYKGRAKIKSQIYSLESGVKEAEGKSYYDERVKMLNVVQEAYNKMSVGIKRAEVANKQFEEKVEEFIDKKKFADSANSVMSAISELGGNGKMDLNGMLDMAAFESIEEQFNESLAGLEIEAERLGDE